MSSWSSWNNTRTGRVIHHISSCLSRLLRTGLASFTSKVRWTKASSTGPPAVLPGVAGCQGLCGCVPRQGAQVLSKLVCLPLAYSVTICLSFCGDRGSAVRVALRLPWSRLLNGSQSKSVTSTMKVFALLSITLSDFSSSQSSELAVVHRSRFRLRLRLQ